jgi:chromosome partitioning protein
VICALISRKGGVGKTTTAVNLAAALAGLGHRVLLVDLDSQASASMSLGLARENLAPSVADVLFGGLAAADAVRPTATAGLELVSASVDLIHAETELGHFRGREIRLQSALAPLAPLYDYIFLDCPSSLSLVTVNGIVASGMFVVPATPQFLAAAGVQNLLATAERIAWDARARTRPVGVLLTMVDYRSRVTREMVDRLRRDLGSLVFAIEIRINTRLAEAPGHGQTIFQYDPAATGAAAYRLLADEFLLRARDLDRVRAVPARA